MLLAEVLKRATGYLETHGSSSPRLDAELLLAHALALRRLDVYLQHDRDLSEAELTSYRELIRRRGEGEPVAYLTGRKEFMGLEFEVTRAVLVPNPDTETLVQRAVTWARERAQPLDFADVGTGSGCIAVAIAHYAPQVRVFAADIDAAALEVAARNVARHHLEDRVALAQGDLLQPLPGRLDAICANLPYVAQDAILPPEVTAQPPTALYAGDQGNELVERLLRESPGRLNPAGVVLLEIDPPLLEKLGPVADELFRNHRVHRDLGGLERVLELWDSRAS